MGVKQGRMFLSDTLSQVLHSPRSVKVRGEGAALFLCVLCTDNDQIHRSAFPIPIPSICDLDL